MWVSELNRTLEGAQLAIWTGESGLPADQVERIKSRWRSEATPPPLPDRPERTARPPLGRRKCGCGR